VVGLKGGTGSPNLYQSTAYGVPLRTIALISDLHLEERRDPSPLGAPPGMFQVYGSLSLPSEIDADVMVIAGDTHPYPEVRGQVLARIEDVQAQPKAFRSRSRSILGLARPLPPFAACSAV
jgi:hypothetical protein